MKLYLKKSQRLPGAVCKKTQCDTFSAAAEGHGVQPTHWHVNLRFLPNESVHDGKMNLFEQRDVSATRGEVPVQCAVTTNVRCQQAK